MQTYKRADTLKALNIEIILLDLLFVHELVYIYFFLHQNIWPRSHEAPGPKL